MTVFGDSIVFVWLVIIAAVLTVLRLVSVLTWSWWLITLPLWIVPLALVIELLLAFGLGLFYAVRQARR